MQYHEHTSLFACDAYSVYSNKSIELIPGHRTRIIDSDLVAPLGGIYHTALNTPVFMELWSRVLRDGIFDHYAWTVKVDPDTVFLPDRLRGLLQNHSEAPGGMYVNNCKYGLHGPIEVFSRNAVRAWALSRYRCL